MLHKDEPYHDGTWTVFTKEPTRLTPFHVMDGLTFYLAETDENPDDEFTTDRFAKLTSVPNQAPGDEDQANSAE